MAPKKQIGIQFMIRPKTKSFVRESKFGGGSDLDKFGSAGKKRESGISGALAKINIEYQPARKEFFQFCSDLWIAIVRNSVWSKNASGPSPMGMIYTRINSDGVDFGWRNYPTKKKEGAPDHAPERFRLRSEIFERIVGLTGKQWFTEGLKGDKAIRSVIAGERVRAAISEVMSMTAPSGQDMPFQVPVRAGVKKGGDQGQTERLHPNARAAQARKEYKALKYEHIRSGGRRKANYQDDE